MDVNRIYLTNLIIFIVMITAVHGEEETNIIRLGALFSEGDSDKGVEQAFLYAIERINRGYGDLINSSFKITPVIRYIRANDSLDVTSNACQLLTEGVVAIFGPTNSDGAPAAASVCNSFKVPHIDTRWNYLENTHLPMSINFFPSDTHISKIAKAIILRYGWNKISVVYETEKGLGRLREVLPLSFSEHLEIKFHRIEVNRYKNALKQIKNSGFKNIIFDCTRDVCITMLGELLEEQMLRPHFHYLFLSLDMSIDNIERYGAGDVNMTFLHLADHESPLYLTLAEEWTERTEDFLFPAAGTLIFDAVHAVVSSAKNFTNLLQPETLQCNNRSTKWRYGEKFFNRILMTEFNKGITGEINFDEQGRRLAPTIFISELFDRRYEQIGQWDRYSGLEVSPMQIERHGNGSYSNRTLIVTTIQEKPYVMRKPDKDLQGNDRYEGFCIDLLKHIAKSIGFRYVIRETAKSYGTLMENGKWSGLIGELADRTADLAVAPLTITYDREKVVDFSKPFMFLGITILYRVPEPQNPGVFSFLNPLAFDVWLYVVIAYLCVSLTLFLLARFSPYEWYNSHPCNPEYDEVENQFSFFNCLWFAFGGLMQQGSEINPRAFSTRVLSGFWWFFSLILISSYTANLAAFLTVERMVSPIQNADDLAEQTAIEYGTLAGGASETFFKNSKIPTYQTMWDFMESKPDVLTPDYKVGIDRVLNSKNYAYLMESTTAAYTIAQHCDNLTQIGGLLNSRGYGIGTPLGSPLRDEITKEILRLQEEDIILKLENKWWKKANCAPEMANKEDANELDLSNIGGIFLVLLAGLFAGLLTAVCEFIWKSRQNAEIDKKSLCGEMMAEMRFACRCNAKRRTGKTMDQTTYIPAPLYTHRHSVNGNIIPITETVA